MSFSKLNMPDALLAGLFQQGLVVIDSEINSSAGVKATSSKDPATVNSEINTTGIAGANTAKRLSYLGNNKKHISIVVNDEHALHLQDELLDILSAILNACKLNLADVAIINNRNQPVNDQLLRAELQPASVLLFGVETSQVGLPFSIPDYKTQLFNNCTYLQAAPLDAMKGSSTEARMEKSKLWLSLKTMFGI